MPKTEEEIVKNAMRDWNAKHKCDENWLKSRILGAWRSGYASGYADRDAELLKTMEETDD